MLQYGDTALHKAATQGKVEIINLLVKHGAAVDIRNKVEANFSISVGSELNCKH